jgi:cell filamentation protein
MTTRYLQDDGLTLHNKLGVTDPITLALKEAVHVERRAIELESNGFPQATGFDFVKAVHRHLFQDVYEWAGELRTLDITKYTQAERDTDIAPFAKAADLERDGRRLFDDLRAANRFRGLTRDEFANHLAPFFGRLNQLHPFREGNGRTQRLVWEHLAKRAGHELDFKGISRERMTVVSIAGNAADYAPAQRMFAELLDPARSHALRTATRSLDINWQDLYVATTQPGRRYAGSFLSTDGRNFLLADGKSLFVGALADLPNHGRECQRDDRVAFRAGDGSMTRAAQFRERIDEVAGRISAQHREEREAYDAKERSRELEREKEREANRRGDRDRDRDRDR